MPNRNTLKPSTIDNHDHMKKWFGLMLAALLAIMVVLIMLTIQKNKVMSESKIQNGVASESSITVGEKETDWLDAMDSGYGGKDVLPDEIAPSFDYRNISTLEAAKSEQKQ